MDANSNSLIGIEGSRRVFEVLDEWILCGRRAIGEALIEVGQLRGAGDLAPLGNHRPGLAAYPLFVALIKSVPYGLERGTGYKAHAYVALLGLIVRKDDIRNWDVGVPLDEPHSGFFTIPYTSTALADQIVIIAYHMAPTLPAKDANFVVTVVAAYSMSVPVDQLPQPHYDMVHTRLHNLGNTSEGRLAKEM